MSQAVAPRLLSVLIPAVGGQGGGVLAEWIVAAAVADGLAAHGTSIPGVAQRTGSTTYYVEVFDGPADSAPAFSLYPIPGALDVLLAPELLEVGRAIERGIPSPQRTTIIASRHRLYSIHEKLTTGRGIYEGEMLEVAARQFGRRLIAVDALAAAREHGTEVNAILLGMLAATEALPIRLDAYRAAIKHKGTQVEANLRGFECGLDLVGRAPVEASRESKWPLRTPPAYTEALGYFPESLRPLVGEALARLIDYQDEKYAALYLERLAPFVAAKQDRELARIVARHLAVWMTYEDAIRVADLKTRAGRLARIRAEAGTGEVEIIDYLKPDLDELYGMLPYRLVAPFARWAERRWPHGRPTLGQCVKTTSVLGFLRLWLLARCRRFRPRSYRGQREHERMERWLTAVARCAEWSEELACEVARAGQLVKGYGDVRRRLAAVVEDLVQSVLQAASLEAPVGGGFAVSTALAATYRRLVLEGPEGETRASALAVTVLRHLAASERQAALAAVSAVPA